MTVTRPCWCTRYQAHPTSLGYCRCNHWAESHDPDTGVCGVRIEVTRPLTITSVTPPMPTPDPDFPDPGIPEALKGPRLRLAYACWRYGVWDDRVREARAAFQGSLDEGTGGDVWWERHLNIALGKRALWQNRIDRYSV